MIRIDLGVVSELGKIVGWVCANDYPVDLQGDARKI